MGALLLTQLWATADGPPRPDVIDHVTYLASPELKGRKPLSRGSKKARNYITEHFASLGLVPWGTAKGFEQSVLMGTNVVGILPGGDPTLKDEIVLVSAHYDHLGKGHLGAADNAAGVAALLELASRLSTAPEPPKRSIAFAAFDCEERGLWGSVCFSIREDFDPAKITLNVNIDMLGRKGFDVMENTLFIAASHALPPLDMALADSEIDVLPVPAHVASARSDHAVFESMGIPVAFFSSGLFGDYHQKEDTLENLDMALVAASAEALTAVLAAAASAPALEARPIPPTGTDVMLASVARVQEAMLANATGLGMKAEALEACRVLHADTLAHLGAPACDPAVHENLIVRGITTLGPVVLDYQYALFEDDMPVEGAEENEADGDALEADADTSLDLEAASYYLASLHNAEFFDAYREYARKVTSRARLDLMLRGLPHQHSEAFPLQDDEYVIRVGANGIYRLSAIIPNVNFSAHPRRFLRVMPSGFAEASFDLLYFEGTRDESVDFLLRKWEQPTFGGKKKDTVYEKFLQEITGKNFGPEFDVWKAWRWGQLGIEVVEPWRSDLGIPMEQWGKAHLKSAKAWQRRFMESDNPLHQFNVFGLPNWIDPDGPGELRAFANDAAAPVFARIAELDAYVLVDMKRGEIYATPDMLSQLARLVEDATPITGYETYLLTAFDWDALPLMGAVMREWLRLSISARQKDMKTSESVGQLVHRRLQVLSGATDVPPTHEAWAAWLQDAWATDPEGKLLPKLREISFQHGEFSLQNHDGRYKLAFNFETDHLLPVRANLWSSGRGYEHKYPDSYRFRPPGMKQKMAASRRLPVRSR